MGADSETLEARRYGAFVSYSHSDEGIARWLHRRLENYRTPKPLIGRDGRYGPVRARIGKVFRDREEFAAGGNLTDEIEAALREAEALIVLCSPAARGSVYVNAEIEYFKKLGRSDRIVPVIVSGDTVECFPEALRDGRERVGADLREGKDGRDAGVLKLIAGVLGVGLDELVRREAAAQAWRVRAATGLAVGFLSLAVAAGWFAFDATQKGREAAEQRDAAFAALGRTFADRAWNAVDNDDHALAAKYTLSGLRVARRYHDEFRAIAARIAFDLPQSEIWATPTQPIRDVIFSDDGRYAATLEIVETIPVCIVRDVPARTVISRIENCVQAGYPRLQALHVRDQSVRLLTSAMVQYPAKLTIELWDARTGARLGRQEGAATHASVSIGLLPDGATVLMPTDGDRGFRLVDLTSGREVWRHTQEAYAQYMLLNDLVVQFQRHANPNTQALTRLWSTRTQRILATLPNSYTGACLAEDRLFLLDDSVTPSSATTARVDIFRLASATLETRWSTTFDGFFKFSRDCSVIGAYDFDPAPVATWDARTGRELARIELPGGNEQRMSLAPTGQGALVWTAFDEELETVTATPAAARLFSAHTGQELNTLRGHRSMFAEAYWSDNQHVLTTDGSGNAIFRRLTPRFALAGPLGGLPDTAGGDGENILLFAINPEGVGGVAIPPFATERTQRLPLLRTFPVRDISVSHDATLMAGVGRDGRVGVWRRTDGTMRHDIGADQTTGEIIMFSFDQRRVVVGDTQGGLRVIDLASNSVISRFDAPREGAGDGVGVIIEGRFWNDDNENNLAISRDGALVATAVDSTRVRLRDAETGAERAVLETPARVNAVAFDKEGARLLVAGRDGALRVFDVATGGLRATLLSRSLAVSDVAVSDSGRLYASAGFDGVIVLWDAATSREIVRLHDHRARIVSLGFSTDGSALISLDEDSEMRMWLLPHLDAPLETLTEYLCTTFLNQRARSFTTDEISGNPLIRDVWLSGADAARDVCEG